MYVFGMSSLVISLLDKPEPITLGHKIVQILVESWF